jgi:hypothetical protein
MQSSYFLSGGEDDNEQHKPWESKDVIACNWKCTKSYEFVHANFERNVYTFW